MRTAEEVLKKWYTPLYGIGDIAELQIVEAMKEYAKEVAKESLKNASENADLEVTTNNRKTSYKSVSYNSQGLWGVERNIVVVDKQSILNESNIPEL